MNDLAEELVKSQEGLRLTAYRDKLGLWTCGWGHLLDQDRDWSGYKVPYQQAADWLETDMNVAYNVATRFPFFFQLNEVRQAVLISMTFQMGSKPLYWPRFNAALEAGDFEQAEKEGLDSLWAKQTPERAELEMGMLRTGTWAQS